MPLLFTTNAILNDGNYSVVVSNDFGINSDRGELDGADWVILDTQLNSYQIRPLNGSAIWDIHRITIVEGNSKGLLGQMANSLRLSVDRFEWYFVL